MSDSESDTETTIPIQEEPPKPKVKRVMTDVAKAKLAEARKKALETLARKKQERIQRESSLKDELLKVKDNREMNRAVKEVAKETRRTVVEPVEEEEEIEYVKAKPQPKKSKKKKVIVVQEDSSSSEEEIQYVKAKKRMPRVTRKQEFQSPSPPPVRRAPRDYSNGISTIDFE